MNILLVEDDIFFQKFYSTKLTENNYTVDVANNGEEGLQKMKAAHYDLILLDLVMPKMDGFEVLKAKAQDLTIKDIPVLIFSTLGQEQDIKKAKDMGARDYMNKTFFNFEELINKIKTVTS